MLKNIESEKKNNFDYFLNKRNSHYKIDLFKILERFENQYAILRDRFFSSEKEFINFSNCLMIFFWLNSKLEKSDDLIDLSYPKEFDFFAKACCFLLLLKLNLQVFLQKRLKNIYRKPENNIKNKDLTNKPFTSKTILETNNRILAKTEIKKELKDFNLKFNNSDNMIKILLICSDTTKFIKNVASLINGYTGLYSNKPYIKNEDFNNVDFIVLSNCTDAHINSNLVFNVWVFENYINFVFPMKLNKNNEELIKMNNFIAKFFNDKFMDFFNHKDSEYNENAYGVFLLQLINYIKIKFPWFYYKEHLNNFN